MPMNNIISDSENYSFRLGIPDDLRKEYPIINMALLALTKILQNDHLQKNFYPHFIPIDQYQYDYPKQVPESIRAQIKQVFTDENLPRVIFQDDSQLFAINDCSVYGLYNGRLLEQDENIIYVNKESVPSLAENMDQQVKYAALILFTILHELGHWTFYKFSCNLDEGKHTPCDVTDLSSLRIPKNVSFSCLVLDEELMKFQGKRVFDPVDELQLISTSKSVTIALDKRVFESCDKLFCGKVQNERSKT
ncbi:unnamed protein product [Rotaria sp. Silwood1]|nr:unnamed protein product [Rotaria sp. Silwood1]